ncbi:MULTISPECIES: hypothetical protein [unclassified Pseudomonas]|uniref:hypothetical protein n=1 Tax=unclassified Pseudomonas TaxID=196821 RepID=UPI0025DF6F70|nr:MULTISPECIES: hypothetical protein [unclassified Pseudomonas]
MDVWLARIYDDQSLTNSEFRELRDEADRRVDDIKSQYPQRDDLAKFQQVADDAVQLMQTGILAFKKQKLRLKPRLQPVKPMPLRSHTSKRAWTVSLRLFEAGVFKAMTGVSSPMAVPVIAAPGRRRAQSHPDQGSLETPA